MSLKTRINVTAVDCVNKNEKKLNGTNHDLCKYVHFQKMIIKNKRRNLQYYFGKSFGKQKIILLALGYQRWKWISLLKYLLFRITWEIIHIYVVYIIRVLFLKQDYPIERKCLPKAEEIKRKWTSLDAEFTFFIRAWLKLCLRIHWVVKHGSNSYQIFTSLDCLGSRIEIASWER